MARLPDDLRAYVASSSSNILLSRVTAEKNRARHPEADDASFLNLQVLLDKGTALSDRPRHVLVHGSISGLPWLVVVKVTGDGQRVYLQSFRRTDAANIRRIGARSVEVRRSGK